MRAAIAEHPLHTRSPLERARSKERFATYAISIIIAVVVLLVARAFVGAPGDSVQDHFRLVAMIATFAQFVVAVTTLVIVRNQVSVAVHQIEHADASQSQIRDLTRELELTRATLRAFSWRSPPDR